MDLYEILGINKNSSAEEIKKAYRKKAKENHPDKGGTEDKFAEINEANSVLSDPEKRKVYDETGQIKVRSFEDELNKFIDSFLWQAVKQCNDPKTFDLIGEIIELIQKKREGMKEWINEKGPKDLDNLREISKRIKVKNGENVLSQKIDGQLHMQEEQLKKLKDSLDFMDKAEAWLEDYSYQRDNVNTVAFAVGDFTTVEGWGGFPSGSI